MDQERPDWLVDTGSGARGGSSATRVTAQPIHSRSQMTKRDNASQATACGQSILMLALRHYRPLSISSSCLSISQSPYQSLARDPLGSCRSLGSATSRLLSWPVSCVVRSCFSHFRARCAGRAGRAIRLVVGVQVCKVSTSFSDPQASSRSCPGNAPGIPRASPGGCSCAWPAICSSCPRQL